MKLFIPTSLSKDTSSDIFKIILAASILKKELEVIECSSNEYTSLPCLKVDESLLIFGMGAALRFVCDEVCTYETEQAIRHLEFANQCSLTDINDSLVVNVSCFVKVYMNDVKLDDQVMKWFIDQKLSDEYSKAIEMLPKTFYSFNIQQCVNQDAIYEKVTVEGKVLPVEGKRNILVTSALPYVNNVPHLGNIIGCVLSGDVFARYCRLKGYQTIHVCGTDEYGTATETKAIEEKMSCQDLCSKYFEVHKEIYEWFNIEFDSFGRTATPKQTEICQNIFQRLYDNGYFYQESVEQLYCDKCERFLADRFVEGTCPTCGFEDARGDQCDGCGKLINAVELVNPRCKLDRNTPTVRTSNHLFLDLPKLQPACEAFAEKSSKEGKWSPNGIGITKSWFAEGIKARCMTRDLKWGVPVPLEGFEGKVFYVWFDAPIGYLSITANYTEEWEKWWKNPDQVKLYQFMGKDNVPFHTVIFPSSLIGTEENYTMLHHLSTTEYLNFEGGKFSKSRGTGVFGNNVVESGIPSSVWRYYLLSNRPENNDSSFTWDDFAAKTNAELLANLGNFVNRILKFLKSKYNGKLPETSFDEKDKEFMAAVTSELSNYNDLMENVKLKSGLKSVMSISSLANSYLQDSKIDTKLFKEYPQKCATVVNVGVNVVYLLSALLEPFMPVISEKICDQLNAPKRLIPEMFQCDLFGGHCIGEVSHLFSRIDQDTVEALRMKYNGTQ